MWRPIFDRLTSPAALIGAFFILCAEVVLHTTEYEIRVTDDYTVRSCSSRFEGWCVATYRGRGVAEHVHAFALVRPDALALDDSTGYLLLTPGDAERFALGCGLTVAEARSIVPADVKRFTTEKDLLGAVAALPAKPRINWVQPKRQMDPAYWYGQAFCRACRGTPH
jgi:hypothetical protein